MLSLPMLSGVTLAGNGMATHLFRLRRNNKEA
jgi:hypothetical protein